MIQEGVQTASGAQPSGTVLLKGDRHESWLSRFATVLAYNRAACSWRADEFGKPARWVHPLKGPTFYASRLFPFKYEAKGGLAITDGFEVLDTRGTPSRDSSPQASPSEAWGLATTPSGPRAIRSAGPSIPAAGPRSRP